MNKNGDKDCSCNDYDKPVAYDADGNPLYAHPPNNGQFNSGQDFPPVVQVVRQSTPNKPIISEAVKAKHKQSTEMYPRLNLSEGEYVISAVKRHQIGLFKHFLLGAILIILALYMIVKYEAVAEFLQIQGSSTIYFVAAPLLLFIAFIILMVYANYYIYNRNRFFLTNESIIQEIQIGLFSHHEQIISLASIEDAAYFQDGIFSQVFNFGSIRLSTVGDETTYKFKYVSNPRAYINILNDAVESFKNGRPVDDN